MEGLNVPRVAHRFVATVSAPSAVLLRCEV